jgi:hypothetical protein
MLTRVITLDDVYRIYPGRDEAEKVKQCIAHFHKDTGIGFVLLMGDSDKFPVRFTKTDRKYAAAFDTAFYPTDLYYAALYKDDGSFDSWDDNGNGYFGELHGSTHTGPINVDRVNLKPVVAVGRAPVSKLEEAKTFVQKTIVFENHVFEASWQKDALLTATHDWIQDACQIQEKVASQSLNAYHCKFLSSTDSPCRSAGLLKASAITDHFNRGLELFWYIGHGSGAGALAIPGGAWGTANVSQLTNKERLPIVCVAACDTAQFATLPPYSGYVDIHGREHRGTHQGERFTSPPPQPACLQPRHDPDLDLATALTVRTEAGAVAYFGGVTGMQYCDPTEYLVQGLTTHSTLGQAWQSMIGHYYKVHPIPERLNAPNWVAVALVHQPWKYALFGDPSLRLPRVKAWSYWELFNTQIDSAPAVASWAPRRLDVFVRGTNHHLMHNWYDGHKWWAKPAGGERWEDLGAPSGVELASAPAAVSWGEKRIDCFVKGNDNRLWHRWYPYQGGWSYWELFNTQIDSAPAVASWAPRRLDVFVRGTNHHLMHNWYDGHKWWAKPAGGERWEDLGAPSGVELASAPAAVSWGEKRIDCFVKGNDNRLWHRWYPYQGGWSYWELFNTQIDSAPAVASWAPRRLDVFVRGTNHHLMHNWYDGHKWWAKPAGGERWEDLGAPSGVELASAPAAVSWGEKRIDCFVKGNDNRLWHRWFR